MGDSSLNAILTMSELSHLIENLPADNMEKVFDFAQLAMISRNVEMMFGARGGRSMALRVGREMFSLGLNRFGAFAGMSDTAFQTLPLENRASLGIQAMAAVFTNFSDQHCRVKSLPEAYLFEVENSPMAWGRTAESPVCHAIVGILQEGLRWASGGHEYHVQEVICRATGGEACIFKVNKNPIGGVSRG